MESATAEPSSRKAQCEYAGKSYAAKASTGHSAGDEKLASAFVKRFAVLAQPEQSARVNGAAFIG